METVLWSLEALGDGRPVSTAGALLASLSKSPSDGPHAHFLIGILSYRISLTVGCWASKSAYAVKEEMTKQKASPGWSVRQLPWCDLQLLSGAFSRSHASQTWTTARLVDWDPPDF